MKVNVQLEFLENFPPDMVREFMEGLELLTEKGYGKLEISINDGKVTMVTPMYHARVEITR